MKTIDKVLKEAEAPEFWGQVQIDYRAGKPVVVRKTETHNINERNEGNQRQYGSNTDNK